ncbi:MAG: hypothetical protein EXR79_06545 [Myxococcales bacterium]|nr:hypothetical protein [Myxococcales bacterium]
MARLGEFVMQHRYRVAPTDRERLLPLLGQIRAYALDLGVATFDVWQDDGDAWQWTELHGYDSWSHAQRLAKKPMPAEMHEVYRSLERLVEGGAEGVETVTWNVADLPDVK